jgi:PEP-CTERM motif
MLKTLLKSVRRIKMKKLLVLALVLSMASLANATLQISVNGVQTATSDTIIVGNSDTTIGIWTNAAIGYQSGDYYVLAVQTADTFLDNTSGVAVSADSGMSILNGLNAVADLSWPVPDAGYDGVGGGAFDMDAAGGIAANTQLFGSFSIKALAPGNYTLKLYESPDAVAPFVLSESVTLHQTPEPITMTLLGLGGLFLRRRK